MCNYFWLESGESFAATNTLEEDIHFDCFGIVQSKLVHIMPFYKGLKFYSQAMYIKILHNSEL